MHGYIIFDEYLANPLIFYLGQNKYRISIVAFTECFLVCVYNCIHGVLFDIYVKFHSRRVHGVFFDICVILHPWSFFYICVILHPQSVL